mgnify:CR=1 FL=1
MGLLSPDLGRPFDQQRNGKALMRVQTHEPVSENPVFTLNRGEAAGVVEASGRDNNGNTFRSKIAP